VWWWIIVIRGKRLRLTIVKIILIILIFVIHIFFIFFVVSFILFPFLCVYRPTADRFGEIWQKSLHGRPPIISSQDAFPHLSCFVSVFSDERRKFRLPEHSPSDIFPGQLYSRTIFVSQLFENLKLALARTSDPNRPTSINFVRLHTL